MTEFMSACHFLEKHMDEVSEPNDEMVIHRRLQYHQEFDILTITFILLLTSRGRL